MNDSSFPRPVPRAAAGVNGVAGYAARVALAASFLVGLVQGAAAQVAMPTAPNAIPVEGIASDSVTGRARPELDALGTRLGGFLLFPQLGVNEVYDDNIFADPSNQVDDFVTHIDPSLELKSNWNNHALNFFASGDIARHMDRSSEDWNDARVGVNGRLDVLRSTEVDAEAIYYRLHEDRSSPDDVRGTEPTLYSLYHSRIGGSQAFGRFKLRLDGVMDRYNFSDVQSSAGEINNDDRDRYEWTTTSRLSYEIIPNYHAFIQGGYNWRRYDNRFDDNGIQRDSQGYEADVGTAIELTHLISAEIFGGWRQQDYDDPTLPTVTGPAAGLGLTWNVTRLTTIKGFVNRKIEETSRNGAAGYFATRTGASVDHELLRNLIIGASGGFENDDFKGIDRNDDIVSASAYARYLMNRYIHLTLRYRYAERSSNAAGQDYTDNLVLAGFSLQY